MAAPVVAEAGCPYVGSGAAGAAARGAMEPGAAVPGAAVPGEPVLVLFCAFNNSSALTSRSSCSLNWRAMARARPIQLPTWRATWGSRSGPNTMSAMAEVRSISENPTSSMRHQALVFGGTLASASRRAAPASKSASFSCLSCFRFSSASPSFMDCLKPLTAAPRSEPMLRKRLVPNITKAMSKMTNSIFESNMSLLRSQVKSSRAPIIRQRDYDIGRWGINARPVSPLEPERHGPLVGQRNPHMGAENAGFDPRVPGARRLDQ